MNEVFADTFFFIALLSERDEAHGKAHAAASTLDAQLVTRPWVLTEVADAFALPPNRPRFLALLRFLRSNPRALVVELKQETFDQGVALFEQRPDKSWSLTDCISFVVMQTRGVRDALTADHHFESVHHRARHLLATARPFGHHPRLQAVADLLAERTHLGAVPRPGLRSPA